MLYWCFSFWLTSLCIISSSFIHLIRTDSNAFFLIADNIPLCIIPQISYPFVCWWTSRLLPCPGYYKQCSKNMAYACLFQFWFPRCVCLTAGLLGHMAALFPIFKGISTLFSIVAVPVWIPTNSVRGFPFLHTRSSTYCLYTFGKQPFWLAWNCTSLWFWFSFLW